MIQISNENKEYLLAMDILKKLKIALGKDNNLSDADADELRDICTSKFDYCGLDEDYNETKEGAILNKLIDALYVC